MNPALKKKIYHYAMVTLACAIMGIAMNTFYMPNKMLSGGIGGVAVLAYYVAGLPMGATSLICNVQIEESTITEAFLDYITAMAGSDAVLTKDATLEKIRQAIDALRRTVPEDSR